MVGLGSNVSFEINQKRLSEFQGETLTSDQIWEEIFSNKDLRDLYDDEAIKGLKFSVVTYLVIINTGRCLKAKTLYFLFGVDSCGV